MPVAARVAARTPKATSAIAAALAATGIHGIVAYAVSRRRRELAIRMAVGAPRRSLVQLVLRRTFILVGAGTALGFGLALALSSVLTSVLYTPADNAFWPWAAVGVLVALVAAIACAWPTWRALRVDPVVALTVE